MPIKYFRLVLTLFLLYSVAGCSAPYPYSIMGDVDATTKDGTVVTVSYTVENSVITSGCTRKKYVNEEIERKKKENKPHIEMRMKEEISALTYEEISGDKGEELRESLKDILYVKRVLDFSVELTE